MNTGRSRSLRACAGLRRTALLALLLACHDEDQCALGAEPCGADPGTFLECYQPDPFHGAVFVPSGGTVFEAHQCEGFEPVCRPVGQDGHECVDEVELETCRPSRIAFEQILPRTSTAIEWADVDGDKISDLIFECRNTQAPWSCGLWLARGRADGGFDEPVEIRRYRDVYAIARYTGDVDGDGQRDLVVEWTPPKPPDVCCVAQPSTLEVLLGDDDGFELAEQRMVDGYSHLRAVYDLDADGADDLLVTTGTGVVILELENGALAERESFEIDSGRDGFDSPSELEIADLEGSGHPDLLVYVYPNYQIFHVRDGRYVAHPEAGVRRDAILADMNGDRATDLIEIGIAPRPPLQVSTSKRDGSFTLHASIELPYDGRPVVGDFDGDARNDIAMLYGESRASLFVGMGDGFLEEPRHFAIDPQFQSSELVIDADGDGGADLVELEFTPETGVLRAIVLDRACL